MAGHNDEIDASLQAISEDPGFDGMLLRRKRVGPGNTPDDFKVSIIGPPGIGMTGLKKMLEVVLDRLSATKELTTKDVVNELVSRPGFNGVVVRAPHMEAAAIRGGAELVTSFDPKRLNPVVAVNLLRAAADYIESSRRN